nr:glycosyltransferase family 8 protein [Donghicola mangrovi]
MVCVTDNNYAPHLSALLKSIEVNKGQEHVRAHVIFDGIDGHILKKIRKTVPGLEILDYHVEDHLALTLPPLLQISRATYLRLIISEILPDYVSKVLYLDIDMIVTCSLLRLWDTDLTGYPCGAVEDPGVEVVNFAKTYDLEGNGLYFNAGMLLIDMNSARQCDFLNQALAQLLDGLGRYEFADQDALNEQLWRNWLPIDPSWNFQREHLYKPDQYATRDTVKSLPSIIHFTEATKPWEAGEWHPHAWLYWYYLMRTPFFTTVRQSNIISTPRLAKFFMKYWLMRMRFNVLGS